MTAPLSAADLARLVAMQATLAGLYFDVDEGNDGMYAQDANCDTVPLEEFERAKADAVVALLNAAPSLLAEVGRLRKLEELASAVKDWREFRSSKVSAINPEHQQAIADHDAELQAAIDAAIAACAEGDSGNTTENMETP